MPFLLFHMLLLLLLVLFKFVTFSGLCAVMNGLQIFGAAFMAGRLIWWSVSSYFCIVVSLVQRRKFLALKNRSLVIP